MPFPVWTFFIILTLARKLIALGHVRVFYATKAWRARLYVRVHCVDMIIAGTLRLSLWNIGKTHWASLDVVKFHAREVTLCHIHNVSPLVTVLHLWC